MTLKLFEVLETRTVPGFGLLEKGQTRELPFPLSRQLVERGIVVEVKAKKAKEDK